MKYIPNFTGLRFFLASLVILFHIPQFCSNRGFPSYNDLPLFNKGLEAVLMFFSLSGYLIIRKLYEEKKVSNISLKKFYKNRILRIFPLYYLVLFIGFIYYYLVLPKLNLASIPNGNFKENVFLGVTFFANVLAKFKPGGIIEVLWSIGIEEQFYLLIAPLFFLLPFFRLKLALIVFTIVSLFIFYFEYIIPAQKWQLYFFYFSFSGLISICYSNYRKVFSSLLFQLLIYILLALCFFSSTFDILLNRDLKIIVLMIIFPLFLGCLNTTKTIIFENKFINYLGKISYGIYVYHPIVMQIVGFIFLKGISPYSMPNNIFIVIFNVLTFSFTILLSHFSYKYYESFFLKKKNKSYSHSIN